MLVLRVGLEATEGRDTEALRLGPRDEDTTSSATLPWETYHSWNEDRPVHRNHSLHPVLVNH